MWPGLRARGPAAAPACLAGAAAAVAADPPRRPFPWCLRRAPGPLRVLLAAVPASCLQTVGAKSCALSQLASEGDRPHAWSPGSALEFSVLGPRRAGSSPRASSLSRTPSPASLGPGPADSERICQHFFCPTEPPQRSSFSDWTSRGPLRSSAHSLAAGQGGALQGEPACGSGRWAVEGEGR